MKKLTLWLTTTVLLLTSIPTQLKAESKPSSFLMASSRSVELAEAKSLLARLDEIDAMDKSKLSSSEKKQLRKEVKGIKKNLDHGGAYISVGGLIIILLLLIILL